MRAFLQLERRLARMADGLAASEARWRAVAAEDRRGAAAELVCARRAHAVALAAKDAVIEGFRQQVDGLLDAVKGLQVVPRGSG